jgi:hypothetical protein
MFVFHCESEVKIEDVIADLYATNNYLKELIEENVRALDGKILNLTKQFEDLRTKLNLMEEKVNKNNENIIEKIQIDLKNLNGQMEILNIKLKDLEIKENNSSTLQIDLVKLNEEVQNIKTQLSILIKENTHSENTIKKHVDVKLQFILNTFEDFSENIKELTKKIKNIPLNNETEEENPVIKGNQQSNFQSRKIITPVIKSESKNESKNELKKDQKSIIVKNNHTENNLNNQSNTEPKKIIENLKSKENKENGIINKPTIDAKQKDDFKVIRKKPQSLTLHNPNNLPNSSNNSLSNSTSLEKEKKTTINSNLLNKLKSAKKPKTEGEKQSINTEDEQTKNQEGKPSTN